MFDLTSWLFQNQNPQAAGQQQNPLFNLSPMQQKMPGSPASPPSFGNMSLPTSGMSPAASPLPNRAAPTMPNPMTAMGGMPGALPTSSAPGQSPQSDSLRKMMLMQFLMGGGEEGQTGPISSGLPSGAGMKGQGGFQNDPSVPMLNSFPGQLPPRKRFIGGGGGY